MYILDSHYKGDSPSVSESEISLQRITLLLQNPDLLSFTIYAPFSSEDDGLRIHLECSLTKAAWEAQLSVYQRHVPLYIEFGSGDSYTAAISSLVCKLNVWDRNAFEQLVTFIEDLLAALGSPLPVDLGTEIRLALSYQKQLARSVAKIKQMSEALSPSQT